MFDRVWTFGLPNNSGPDAQQQSLMLPDARERLYLEAWLSNFGSSNAHIIRGALSVAQAQQELARGFIDVLMTVTSAGPTRIKLPDDVGNITVFFEAVNNSGQFEAVTVRVFDT